MKEGSAHEQEITKGEEILFSDTFFIRALLSL